MQQATRLMELNLYTQTHAHAHVHTRTHAHTHVTLRFVVTHVCTISHISIIDDSRGYPKALQPVDMTHTCWHDSYGYPQLMFSITHMCNINKMPHVGTQGTSASRHDSYVYPWLICVCMTHIWHHPYVQYKWGASRVFPEALLVAKQKEMQKMDSYMCIHDSYVYIHDSYMFIHDSYVCIHDSYVYIYDSYVHNHDSYSMIMTRMCIHDSSMTQMYIADSYVYASQRHYWQQKGRRWRKKIHV